jgi:cell division protein FtsQ
MPESDNDADAVVIVSRPGEVVQEVPGVGEVATPWRRTTAPDTVTTRVQERLDERKRAGRVLLAQRWGKRMVIAGAVAAAAWVVALSPLFAFDPARAEVAGFGSVVDPSDVLDLIAAQEGTSLVLLNPGGLEAAIGDVRGVREVTVDKVWPRGLHVAIVSREPVAAVPQAGGGFAFVDADALSVGRSDEAPEALPIIQVPMGEDNGRVLGAALGVLNAMPQELRARISGVSAATQDSVEFTLREGPLVEWGSADDSALKVEVLQVLLQSKDAASASVIDVSAPTLPITRD